MIPLELVATGDILSESQAWEKRKRVEGENDDREGGRCLCLTLVTMGHFLGQARSVHVGLVPVS